MNSNLVEHEKKRERESGIKIDAYEKLGVFMFMCTMVLIIVYESNINGF